MLISDRALGRIETALRRESPPFAVGKFECVRLLGRGGMGEVWLAHDRELDREVAVKFLTSGSPDALVRFQREARQQAALVHPGILPVYEVGELDGKSFIAMRHVDGVPIGRLAGDWRERARVFAGACDAVAHAHERGIVHRDLKPANILVENSVAYVLDFGLARPVKAAGASLTETGILFGTPSHMSPEQASGLPCDFRSDIFSLGASLYECATGRPPFDGATVWEILSQASRGSPPLPRSVHCDVPREIEAIVMKAMDREPGQRYASAREMAEDLRRFAEGRPVRAATYGPARRLAFRMRRHPVRTALGGMSLLLLLALAAFVVNHNRQKHQQKKILALLECAEQINAFDRLLYLPIETLDLERERTKLEAVRVRLDELSFQDRPGRAEQLRLRAGIHLLDGRLEEAYSDLREALRRDPRTSLRLESARVGLSLLLDRWDRLSDRLDSRRETWISEEAGFRSRFDEVACDLKLVPADAPESGLASLFLSYLQERYAEARKGLEKLISELEPSKTVDLWLWIGHCFRGEGNLERALAAYRRAQELKRCCFDAWMAEAEALCHAVVMADEWNDATHRPMLDAALRSVAVAQRIQARDPRAWRLEGELCRERAGGCSERGEPSSEWFERALQALTHALQRNETDEATHGALAVTCLEYSDDCSGPKAFELSQRALRHARRAVELGPDRLDSAWALMHARADVAWGLADRGIDPSSLLRESDELFSRVRSILVGPPDLQVHEVDIVLAHLRWRRHQGEEIAPEVADVLSRLRELRRTATDETDCIENAIQKAESLRSKPR